MLLAMYQAIGGTPTVVATVIGLIITVVVSRYYAQQGAVTKAIGWIPIGISKIVTRPVSDVSKGLALTWNGDPLKTPYTVQIRILNAGTREILQEDFSRPLTVDYKNSTCYEAIVTHASDRSIKDSASIHGAPGRQLEVKMPGLNRSDWVELEMVADGPAEYPTLNCRLVGETQRITPVPGAQRARTKSLMLRFALLGAFVLNVGIALLGFQSFTLPEGPTLWPAFLIGIGGLAFAVAILVWLYCWLQERQEWAAVKAAAPEAFEVRSKGWLRRYKVRTGGSAGTQDIDESGSEPRGGSVP